MAGEHARTRAWNYKLFCVFFITNDIITTWLIDSCTRTWFIVELRFI
jgi:hypothetical protein